MEDYSKRRVESVLARYKKSKHTAVPPEILESAASAQPLGDGPWSSCQLMPWLCVTLIERFLNANHCGGGSNA